MKIKNYILLIFVSIFSISNVFAQDKGVNTKKAQIPFITRMPGFPSGNIKVKGDVVFVGNNILNPTTTLPSGFDAAGEPLNLVALTAEANTPNSGGSAINTNNGVNFEYIDIDGDATTYSSSSADLALKNNNGTVNSCKRIRYAALYWTAFYPYERSTDINQIGVGTPIKTDWNTVKFKVPGGTYQLLTADTAPDPVGDEDEIVQREYDSVNTEDSYGSPYVCYKNVTSLFTAMEAAGTDTNGTYTVANQRCGRGQNKPSGLNGGWTLVIIYESPSFPSKYITVFDGYQLINDTNPVSYTISGFQTLPAPFPVNAKIGVGALEGDKGLTPDSYIFQSNPTGTPATLSNAVNPADNFFNCSISEPTLTAPFAALIATRNPNSDVTLGFDLDQVNIPNPLNKVIPNGTTSATLTLTSPKKKGGDAYAAFLQTFAVDIIEPKIVLTKVVKNTLGVPIGGLPVALGQNLFYDITFQNIGNDNGVGLTIKDVLPINIIFNPLTDLTLPAGVTLQSYIGGTLVFSVIDNLIKIGDPYQTIQIRVQVATNCNQFSNACSNLIQNQAFATYHGVSNATVITDDPSISSFTTCNITPPSSTNFLVNTSACAYTQNYTLCGTSVVLTAATGYTTHVWTTGGPFGSGAAVVVGGNTPTLTVTAPGTYYVHNTGAGTCLPSDEVITVSAFAGSLTVNPVIASLILPADSNPICGVTLIPLPHINLCGIGASRTIATGITNATISWQVLNVSGTCTAGIGNCPNSTAVSSCWTQVATGSTYVATTAGEYRLVITFAGGCINTFYFNVYTNLLNPVLASKKDIICGTPGQIIIGGVPATGWEFSLFAVGPWQASNTFPITTAATYTVYVRQVGGAVGACIFTVPNINILALNINVIPTLFQPKCNGDKGSVQLDAYNVGPTQYTFSIAGAAVSTSGLISASTFTFPNLNAGVYTYTVTTTNGCTANGSFTLVDPPVLTATILQTQAITCNPGQITVTPSGGTGPYYYYINGSSTFVTSTTFSPETLVITVPVAGPFTYTVDIVDSHNCKITKTITVAPVPPPVFTITQTNIKCYGSSTGAINIAVTNANGYTLSYSIDNGVTYLPGAPTGLNTTGLVAGTYPVIIRYVLGTSTCYTTVQNIIITQPFAALTASGGVSELACGSPALAVVRITNPQGGVPPYSYSFTGIAGPYLPANTASVAPGVNIPIYIQDANGCTFEMLVTIDPIPLPPTISVANSSFACNGSATTTVTVNNPTGTGFTYTYFLDGVVPNIPPNNPIFTGVSTGPHTITVNYVQTIIPTYSNLLNEDFGIGGYTTTPGINPAYCFENQSGIHPPGYTCNLDNYINDGEYAVTYTINPSFGVWVPGIDHTSAGANPKGRYLCVNIGGSAGKGGILYSKPISNVIANQNVQVTLWAENLIKSTSPALGDPNLTIQLVNDLGLGTEVLVASQNTGNVPKSNKWEPYSLTLNPLAYTNLSFVIRSNSTVIIGNDVLIDDIKVFQEPKACTTVRTFPFIVPSGQAFSATITGHNDVTCAGASTGSITIAVQNALPGGYQYSITGPGGFLPTTANPLVISGLPAGLTTVLVRYDATVGVGACSFTLPQTIGTTATITTSAVVTPATCLAGAIVTATGTTGGTTPYTFVLTTVPVGPVVTQTNNPVFTNVPTGNYILSVKDTNGCTNPVSVPVSVTAIVPVAANITGTNYCNTTTTGATIVVNATAGLAPFYFSSNLSPFVLGTTANSNTYTNVTPGTYNIIVKDSNGCTLPLSAITIAQPLAVPVSLTRDLDCITPGAKIDGTVSGGYLGYTYQVSFNSGAYGASVPIVGVTFSYAAAGPGTYQFQITDSKGCITKSSTITINPLIPVGATSSAVNVVCNGASTGSVTVVPSGGTGPLYQINFGAGYLTAGVYTLSGQPAGTINYIVKDSKGCTYPGSQIITQNPLITYTYTINPIQCTVTGTTLGSICINPVTGGVAPYTYTLVSHTPDPSPAPFVTATGVAHCFTNLDFGYYDIIVSDANGCDVTHLNLLMASPPGGLIIDTSVVPATCLVGAQITLTVTGGALGGGPYYFAILPLSPNSTFPNPGYHSGSPLSYTFTGLLSGVLYSFIVYDATTGCYYSAQAATPTQTLSALTSTIDAVKNVSCKGSADGNVSFTFANYSGTSVQYTVYGFPSNAPIAPLTTGTLTGLSGAPVPVLNIGQLAPGTYYILFQELTGTFAGCTITSANFTITESATDLTLSASSPKNDNCGLNQGQVIALAGGGTSPYYFNIYPTGFVPPLNIPVNNATYLAFLATFTSTSSTFNVESGSYDVYVKDANDCIKMYNVPVGLDANPTINPIVTDQCTATSGSFTFTPTGSGIGTLTYSISTSPTVFLPAGTPFVVTPSATPYTVTIKDGNGCTASIPVTIYANIIFNPTALTQPTCVPGNDGSIAVNTPSGGSGNFTYSIFPVVGTYAAGVFSGLPPNTYTISIKDNTTLCPATTATVVLDTPTPVTLNPPTITITSCNGAASTDGGFVVNLVPTTTTINNNPNYTYSITAAPAAFGSVPTVPTTNNVFTNLPSGSYDVTVVSGRGCLLVQTIVVGQPPVIAIAPITPTEFGCSAGTNTTNFAQIVVPPASIIGGSGTYVTYEFVGPAPSTAILQTGSSNSYTTSNFAGGTYTVNVYDNKGCKGSTTVIIKPFIALISTSVSVNVGGEIVCGGKESVTVNLVTAPVAPLPANLQYTIIGVNGTVYGPIVQVNNPIFTGANGLPIGDYLVTVLNQDTGCSIQTNHIVDNPNTFGLVVSNLVPVSCSAGSNGSATITIVDNYINLAAVPPNLDDTGAFSYTIINTITSLVVASGFNTTSSPFSVNITGLPAGSYKIVVTLTGKPFCPVETTFVIGQPALPFALNGLAHTDITCVPGSDGSITVNLPTGGWGGYEYQLVGPVNVPYSTTPSFTGLTNGFYTVNVRDINSNNLLDPTPCTLLLTITLGLPTPILATVTPSTALLPCVDSQTATITVSGVSGGSGSNYTYVLNTILPIPSTSAQQTNPVFSGLGAGSYSVTINDAWGCFTTSPVYVIAEPTLVDANLSLTAQQTCTAPTLQATLTISATGGTPPYRYSSDNITFSVATFNPSVPVLVNPSLVPYIYYVMDANNCKSVKTNNITAPPLVPLGATVLATSVLSIACNGNADGSIRVDAVGGISGASYIYTLLDAASVPVILAAPQTNPNGTGVFTGLIAGTYFVKVDSGDCTYTTPAILIVNTHPALAYTFIQTNVKCFGETNGSMTIVPTGGFGIIKVAITIGSLIPNSNEYFPAPLPAGYTFSDLPIGPCVINIQDELGCFLNFPFTITQPTFLSSTQTGTTVQSICTGDPASFHVTVAGGTLPYSYTLDSQTGPVTTGTAAQTVFDFTNQTGGTHIVYITDANGCKSKITIALNPSVLINPVAKAKYNCPGITPTNYVVVTVDTSVSAPGLVEYSLDGAAYLPNTSTFINLTAGPHYVLVRSTVNGCVKRSDFVVILITPIALTLTDGGLNEIIATTVGGTPIYNYTLNGQNVGTLSNYIITQTGNYTVTVTDASGCSDTKSKYKVFIDIFIPTVFTPTGDGNNDLWGPKNTANYKNIITYVFDRYGRKIITLREGEFWDGKYNGTELPSGDYWYVIKIDGENNDREFVGHFTLYR